MNIARRQHCYNENGSKCWSSGIHNSVLTTVFFSRSALSSDSFMSIIFEGKTITFQSWSNFYSTSFCWYYRFSLCCYEDNIVT